MHTLKRFFNQLCLMVVFFSALPMQGMELASFEYKNSVLWRDLKGGYSSSRLVYGLTYDDATVLSRHGSCLLHGLVWENWSGIYDVADFLKKGELLLHAIPGMVNALNNNRQTPSDAAYICLEKVTSMNGETVCAFKKLISLYRSHGGKTAQELFQEQQLQKNMILLLHSDDNVGDLSMLLRDVRKYIVEYMMLDFKKQITQEQIDVSHECSICMDAHKS